MDEVFRDGTSQRSRSLLALDPSYISVDERNLTDWIIFAQDFAKQLIYFNEQNQPDGDWTPFFDGETKAIADALETIATDSPKAATISADLRQILSQPHMALFLTCLKLLQYPQQQFKELTQRRLDFYYREVLQLTPKAATPDTAHVVLTLAPNQTEYLLAKGTRLSAGKDSRGIDLHYAVDEELLVTQAQVVSVKSLSMETDTIDLDKIRTSDGFEAMLCWALGMPNRGEPLPPLTQDGETSPTIEKLREMFDNLTKAKQEAGAQEKTLTEVANTLNVSQFNSRYIETKLHLSIDDFVKIMSMEKKDANNLGWAEVYSLLNNAQTHLRGLTYTPIIRTEAKAIWTRSLADTDKPPLDLPRFKPFDAEPHKDDVQRGNALGIAIASPVLNLQTGKRTIALTLGFGADSFYKDREQIKKRLDADEIPLILSLSGKQEWFPISIPKESVKVGNILIDTEKLPESYAVSTFSGRGHQASVTLEDKSKFKFNKKDVDTLLVSLGDDEKVKVYRITAVTNDNVNTANVVFLAMLDSKPDKLTSKTMYHYKKDSLFCGFQFNIELDATAPPIVAPSHKEGYNNFQSDQPAIKITIKDSPQTTKLNKTYYQIFKNFCLEKVNIQVKVENLEGVQFRNDRAAIDPKSPFEPFDSQPTIGSRFYFFHQELVSKQLDSIFLKLDWMGLPKDFDDYQAYITQPNSEMPKLTKESFEVNLDLFLNSTWHPIQNNIQLFSDDNKPLEANFAPLPESKFAQPFNDSTANDLLDRSRYLRLELSNQDFQHQLYPLVLYKLAATNPPDGSKAKVNPPYTPKLKSIEVGYVASDEIDLRNNNSNSGQVFHIHPFGYAPVAIADTKKSSASNQPPTNIPFLPKYEEGGSLYIGLRGLTPWQQNQLSLFFQLISGSGSANVEPPKIAWSSWSYLTAQGWQPFERNQVLSDGTNGLLDTGIIRFVIPETATDRNPLMPLGMYWLQATVDRDGQTIPDLLAIRTQAVTATFVDQGNDPERLAHPLSAKSIAGLVERQPAVAKVEQPYISVGGRPSEDQSAFYTRVSERLRHKQRAVTVWDYERLVLERFPQIYKVKCLKHNEMPQEPGATTIIVVVIPRQTKDEGLRLEPRAANGLLREIEAYLQGCASPFVTVAVRNPQYKTINYRVAVKFCEGKDEGYYERQLNEDLVRFLSPWAYDDRSDITFCSTIYGSTVINFISTRDYVEYVANFRLRGDRENGDARANAPDQIIVSDSQHVITPIREPYKAKDYEGIGYMQIGYDFAVE